MEPVTLTAAAIATLVYTKATETTVEKLTESVIEKFNLLRQKIIQRLKGTPKVEAALAKAQQGSKEDLDVVATHLQVAMDTDPTFAQEIQSLARDIHQEINIGEIQGQNVQNVYGGEAYQNNASQAPIIQGVNNSPITFNYN